MTNDRIMNGKLYIQRWKICWKITGISAQMRSWIRRIIIFRNHKPQKGHQYVYMCPMPPNSNNDIKLLNSFFILLHIFSANVRNMYLVMAGVIEVFIRQLSDIRYQPLCLISSKLMDTAKFCSSDVGSMIAAGSWY